MRSSDAIRRVKSEDALELLLSVGLLPILLIVSVLYFALMSDRFLTSGTILNSGRQSIYLLSIALGQRIVLLTAGFDLAVGTTVALSSVCTALVMVNLSGRSPAICIVLGSLAGLGSGLAMGVANGVGVAYLRVSPFIMTLGMASIGFGAALLLTAGIPVTGMPPSFGSIFGYGYLFGVSVPVLIGLALTAAVYVIVEFTRIGKYFYAVGGNIKAARLSGIDVGATLFVAYVLSSLLASIAGILLSARLGSGEPNIGSTFPMESIAACVIAGVSLRGGQGRLVNVILGVLFIGTIQNGMSLARVNSYLQMIILGSIMIGAVVIDQLRMRYMGVEVNER